MIAILPAWMQVLSFCREHKNWPFIDVHVPTWKSATRVMQEQLPRCTNVVKPWMARNDLNTKKPASA